MSSSLAFHFYFDTRSAQHKIVIQINKIQARQRNTLNQSPCVIFHLLQIYYIIGAHGHTSEHHSSYIDLFGLAIKILIHYLD